MIRFATPEDAPKVAEMVEPFFGMALTEMLGEYDRKAMQNLVAATTLSGDACTIIAEVDGNMVGALCALSYQHPMKPSVRIGQELFWWVDPEHRKGGTGKEMLSAFEDWAKSIGCRSVVMATMHGIDHERNGAFYQRSGYGPFEYTYLKEV